MKKEIEYVLNAEYAIGGTTAGKIREAAASCADAARILKTLFPQVFEEKKPAPRNVDIREAIKGRSSFEGGSIEPRITNEDEKDWGGLYLYAYPNYEWVLIPLTGHGPRTHSIVLRKVAK